MKALFIVVILLFNATAIAENSTNLHTVILKHRLAQDIAPKIQSLLPESAKLESHENLLIIKSDQATFNSIKPIIKQLDVAQTNLTITVAFTEQELTQQNTVKQWSASSDQHQNKQFQVRGLAGSPVAISLQNLIPQQSQLFFVGIAGIGGGASTNHINTNSGFEALANLLPDNQVKVKIHPFNSKKPTNNGSIQSNDTLTTLTGSLGTWLKIGSISNNSQIQQENVKSYSTTNNQSQYLYLKITKAQN